MGKVDVDGGLSGAIFCIIQIESCGRRNNHYQNKGFRAVKKIIVLPFLILLLPIHIEESGRADVGLTSIDTIEAPKQLQALSDYIDIIRAHGENPDDQGVLIETLDRSQVLAEHNSNVTFNPASVMKLATSFVALARLGPDYRYRTNFFADGSLDSSSRKLEGDLVVEGAADPVFSLFDAQEVASQLSRLGVSRVTGALRIAGPFYYFANGYHSNLSQETSAAKLRDALQRAGIRIEGGPAFGDKAGSILLSHYSDQLLSILLFQNAHSSNAIAEVVGASLGGPQAIQEYLVKHLGISESELFVGRASGLDFNRITPRATLKLLRALITELADHSLKPEDAMAVAGIDSGTLRNRLMRDDVRGSVIAKTGTLNSLDNGVSTLVGIAYTKAHGPVLFAMFNSGGNVRAYRRLQDQFVEEIIDESGGALQVSRNADALADLTRHPIVQVLYGTGNQPVETATD